MKPLPERSKAIEAEGKCEANNDLGYENGELISRPGAIVGGVTLVGMLFMTVVLIWIIADSSQLGGKIFLWAAIGSLVIPSLLICLKARIYTGPEKITYRNALGFKKSIPWEDIKAVYTASNMGDIKVCGEKYEIMIFSYFNGSDLIEDLIRKFCPDAFHIDSWIDSPVIPKGYRKRNGPLVFGLRKFFRPAALVSLAGFVAGAFSSVSSIPSILVPFILGFFILLILINVFILLCCFVLGVSFDSEKVQFTNAIGMKNRILWRDIVSCEVYIESGTEYIKLCSRDEAIKISQNFSGYQLIGKIINRYCPKKPHRRRNKKR